MTVVADVVAQMRADFSNFHSEVQQGAQELYQFGQSALNEGEKVSRLHELVGILATAVGGTLTAALVGGIQTAHAYVTELERMQVTFGALFGSQGSATTHISQIEDFSQSMGIATSQVSEMSKQLEILTQGQHDTSTEWQAFTNVAAGVGTTVGQVADSFGRAYELMQRSGSIGGQYATRSLLAQGFITPDIANQVTAMAKSGADLNAIWDTLISGVTRFNGAGEAASQTLAGLTSTFHSLVTLNVGEVFQPFITGIEKIVRAADDFMRSDAFGHIKNIVIGPLEELASHLDNVASKLEGLGANLDVSRFDSFVGRLGEMKSGIAVILGLLAEFGTEFIGALPILNRFAQPFIQFLDDGRGGMIALLLVTHEGRQAIMSLVEAVAQLANNVLGGLSGLSGLADVIGAVMIGVIKFTAVIIDFVANNRVMLATVEGVVGALLALLIIDKVVKGFYDFIEGISAGIKALRLWVANFAAKKAVEDESLASTNAHIGATDALASSMERLNIALEQMIALQTQAAGAEGLATSMSLRETTAINANLAAWEETSAAARTTTGMGGMAGGLGIGGAAAMLIGSHVGGVGGDAIGAAGMMAMGASLGTMIAPGAGTAIGAVAGLAAGLAKMAFDAHNATTEINAYNDAVNRMVTAANKGNPIPTGDFMGIQSGMATAGTNLQAAQNQLSTDTFNQPDNKKLLLGDDEALRAAQKVFDEWKSAYGSSAKMVQRASQDTGKSMAEIAEIAKNLNVDLELDPGGVKGSAALKMIEDAARHAGGALVNMSSSAIEQWVKGETAAIDTSVKSMEVQKTAADQVLKNFDKQAAATDAVYSHARAVEQLSRAQENLVKVEESTAHAIDNAAVSLRNANEAYGQATGQVADAQRSLANASAGVTDVLSTENVLLTRLFQDGLGQYISQIVSQANAAQTTQNELTKLNKTYTDQQNEVTKLTDLQKKYQDILKQPLTGTSKFDDALHANQLAQDSASLQTAQLMGAGHYSREPELVALADQLAKLKNTAEQLNLAKALDIGDKQYQLQKLASTSHEVTFEEAKTAAVNVGDLAKQIDSLNGVMADEKPTLDDLNTQYQDQKTRLDALTTALDQTVNADHAMRDAEKQAKDATTALSDAYRAQADQVTAAKDAISAANHELDRLAQDAQRRVLQDNADNIANMISTANEAKTQIGEVQNNMLAGSDKFKDHMITSLADISKFQTTFQVDMVNMLQIEQQLTNPNNTQERTDALNLDLARLSRHLQDVANFVIEPNPLPFDFSQVPVPSTAHSIASADGNLFFAGGGMEDHSAHIARTMRTFAEPETGGEAYIPLASSKRDRSMAILSTVASMFGYDLISSASQSTSLALGSGSMSGMSIADGAIRIDIHDIDVHHEGDLRDEVHAAVSDVLAELTTALDARR